MKGTHHSVIRLGALILGLGGCAFDKLPPLQDRDARPADAAQLDATAIDAGAPDADPSTPDAAAPDAMPPDAERPDARPLDAAAPDAMPPDAARPDAAAPDAVPPDSAVPDAPPPDAAVPDAEPPLAALDVRVYPPALTFRPGDSRRIDIEVTNTGGQPTLDAPSLELVGLSLASSSVRSNTCGVPLQPGVTCSASFALDASTVGAESVSVVVAASPAEAVSSLVAVTVRPPCVATCGASADQSCCASDLVEGNAPGAALPGDYYRLGFVAGSGANPDAYRPVLVSDYRLDRFEVSVGRFREFVDAGYAPAIGEGAHRWVPESGWNWGPSPTGEDLKAGLKGGDCDASFATWTDGVGANENRPVNCVNWLVAMAFCIWDGGYLPSAAEFGYAWGGGSQQRAYPWSVPPVSQDVNEGRASYYMDAERQCYGDGVAGCSLSDLVVVGSKVAGQGRWGQFDLAGNVSEWILDSFGGGIGLCIDCIWLYGSSRLVYGGNLFVSIGPGIGGAEDLNPGENWSYMGFRCARYP
jgi:formylglycine-generating enzyme required for sulfatase activity